MSPNHNFKSQSGFSMIELLVSLAVTTIVTGAAFALVGSSIKFASSTYNSTDAEQSLRAAHEVINRDLTTAGSGLKGMGNISVPKTFVQNYLTQTPIVDPLNPNYVNLALVVSDDNVPANIAVPQASPAVNVMAGTDRLTMLTQDTSFNGGQAVTLLGGKITFSGSNTNILVPNVALFHTGEMYAIASGNSVAFGVVSSIAGSHQASLRRSHRYFRRQRGGRARYRFAVPVPARHDGCKRFCTATGKTTVECQSTKSSRGGNHRYGGNSESGQRRHSE